MQTQDDHQPLQSLLPQPLSPGVKVKSFEPDG